MSENGAKTVRDWKPPKNCSVVYSCSAGCLHDLVVAWKRPAIKGLKRTEMFRILILEMDSIELTFAAMDLQAERHIDRIVHTDSLKLLARGKRTQTADTDRFIAEQTSTPLRTLYHVPGELCPT